MKKYHKKIRLDKDVYAIEGVNCFVTVCTDGKIPSFQNNVLTLAFIEQLKTDAASSGVQVFVYCFMPDHLHLVIAPGTTKDIVKFVGEYKGRTTRIAWGFGMKGKFWQTSFYDHFLRKEEDVRIVVMYVLNNPVRKGLVSEWREYPYSGSLVYEL
ncbi:MAG: transposase [Planctomycetes bacterium]|nr:transposase [Planctomycetota bacterium]